MMQNSTFSPTLRRLVLWLVLVVMPGVLAAQQKIIGRVVDAESGIRLSYVKFYVAPGRGTLSNYDGEFALETLPGDSVTITHIGYSRMRVSAASLPKVVRLQPLTQELSELTVRPINADKILKKVIKRLDREYKKNKGKMSSYFMRTAFWNSDGNELVEAFVDAFSAVAVNNVSIMSGIRNIGDDNGEQYANVRGTNVHYVFESGPRTYESNFWAIKIVPLNDYPYNKRLYDISAYRMSGQQGEELYRIEMKWNHTWPKDIPKVPLLEGTLYIGAKDYALMRFDGQMVNQTMVAYGRRDTIDMDVHVQYEHGQGFTEVSHVAASGNHPRLKFHALLFNLRKKVDPHTGTILSSDLINAIQKAGYESELWDKYDVVRRTKEEEEIAFGKKRDDSPTPPSDVE